MNHPARRLIKVGGSLLGWPGLTDYLERKFPEKQNCDCFLFGGGVIVEVLRDWHKTYGFSQRGSHWLALEAMGVTAKAMALAFPDWELWKNAHAPQDTGKFIIVPAPFCRHDVEMNPGSHLEESWSTTSDSIALRIATEWNFDQLILCKSTIDRWKGDWELAAREGAVDIVFPRLLRNPGNAIQIGWEVPEVFAD